MVDLGCLTGFKKSQQFHLGVMFSACNNVVEKKKIDLIILLSIEGIV